MFETSVLNYVCFIQTNAHSNILYFNILMQTNLYIKHTYAMIFNSLTLIRTVEIINVEIATGKTITRICAKFIIDI